ncbi:MAG: hypothetical protein ACRCV0_04915 [Brevinema sp.]
MSFSYSELSSLLSSKRLRLDKSISLSNLADNFQRASREFPSLARLSRYSLEDLIYRANSNAFDSKKEGISGKDIELTFLLEARKNSFKIDSNIREYSFTDEDKLAFGIDEREFFDLFDRQDRGLGEYLRYIYQETRSSYLPDKIALNHKLNGSPTHRDLMDKVQRSCSNKIIKLETVATEILKQMGQSSPSSSQISDLAKKIADENRLNGDPMRAYIMQDQIHKLSTRSIEKEMTILPVENSQLSNMKQGKYLVSSNELIIFKNNSDKFWERIIKVSGLSANEFHQIRSNFGYTKDKLEGSSIFTPSKSALDSINVSFEEDQPSVNSNAILISKELALHANFLGASIKKIVITSTQRDVKKQAKLMVDYLIDPTKTLYPTVRKWLYNDQQDIVSVFNKLWEQKKISTQKLTTHIQEAVYTKNFKKASYYELWQQNIISKEDFKKIAYDLALKHVTENTSHYLHVGNSKKVFDIGPNSSGHNSSDSNYLNQSIKLAEGKILETNTKLLGEGGEKAYHIVIK